MAIAANDEHYVAELLQRKHTSDLRRVDATDIMKGVIEGKTREEVVRFLVKEEFIPDPESINELEPGEEWILTKELRQWGVPPFIFASDRVDVLLMADGAGKITVVSAEVYQLMP